MRKILETVSDIVTADVGQYCFASYSGGLCANGALSRGVYLHSGTSGEAISIVTQGIIEVIASESVTQGAELSSDASGQAKLAIAGDYVNAIALANGESGKRVLAELKYYKI